MATVHFIPTKTTLIKDFEAAVLYLQSKDPIELVMASDEQRSRFISDVAGRLFNKLETSNRNYSLVLQTTHSNLRMLISSACKKHEAGYSDDKIREIWGYEVQPYLTPLLNLATLTR